MAAILKQFHGLLGSDPRTVPKYGRRFERDPFGASSRTGQISPCERLFRHSIRVCSKCYGDCRCRTRNRITPGASHLVSSKMACSLAGICESITFDPEHGSIMRMVGYSLWKNSAAATDWRQTIDRNSAGP